MPLKPLSLNAVQKFMQSSNKARSRIAKIADLPGIELTKNIEIAERMPSVASISLTSSQYQHTRKLFASYIGGYKKQTKGLSVKAMYELQVALSPTLPPNFNDQDLFSTNLISGLSFTENDKRILGWLITNSKRWS